MMELFFGEKPIINSNVFQESIILFNKAGSAGHADQTFQLLT